MAELRGLKTRGGAAIKKSSYYVWFLGAHESRGLRGDEFLRPVVQTILNSKSDSEPTKVTLQVSSKGLKIIQNGGHQVSKGKNKGEDTVKHFIPEHSITCVSQEPLPNDDVVACILLLYNPVSKCPVHVHAYRCDSVETATVLRKQLQSLVDHPDNQRKFAELEVRLRAKGLLFPSSTVSIASTTTKKSPARMPATTVDSPLDSIVATSDKDILYTLDEKMTNLYDSLAAELREKLNNTRNHGPLLLPPRDYDTVHRQKGNLQLQEVGGADKRKSLQKLVDQVKTELTPSPESSGKSSGIGSDEAPSSPTHERGGSGGVHQHGTRRTASGALPPEPKLKSTTVDSSSDEEWKATSGHQHQQQQQQQHRLRHPHPAVLVGAGVRARIRELQASSPSPPPPQFPVSNPKVVEQERGGGGRSGRSKQHQQDKNISGHDRSSSPIQRIHKNRSHSQQQQHQSSTTTTGGWSANEDRSRPSSKYPPEQQVITDHQHHGYRDNSTRVKRFDSGHSSSTSNMNVIGHMVPHYVQPQSRGGNEKAVAQPAANYQELPQNQRYPGLDRDTARIQSHASYGTPTAAPPLTGSRGNGARDPPVTSTRNSNGGGYEVNRDWNPRDPRDRYSLSPSPSKSAAVSHGDIRRSQSNGFAETSSPLGAAAYSRPSGTSGCRMQPQQQQRQGDEKRFYRYSSTEVDLCRGQRLPATNAYRF